MKKVVIITGATDGLGRSLAILMSKQYDLAICGRNSDKMANLLKELDESCDVYHECFDMLDDKAIKTFCDNSISHFHHIDILINNAGANLKKDRIENIDISLLKQMIQLNCVAQVEMIQGVYQNMKENGKGLIVNILSSCCLFNSETQGSYTASKNAFEAISKILLKEAKQDNISVSSIYPGGIDTGFRATPNHNYLKPETVAKMIINCIESDEGTVHELVFRPNIETNIQ